MKVNDIKFNYEVDEELILNATGHSINTRYLNYANNQQDYQHHRDSKYEITYKRMMKLNYLLGFIDNNDNNKIKNQEKYYYNLNPIKFSYDEIDNILKKLSLNLRNEQFGALFSINESNHNFVLQARTGFGKSLIFNILFNLSINKLNILIVPYKTLKIDMIKRFGESIGLFENIDVKNNNLKTFYLGIFEDFFKINI